MGNIFFDGYDGGDLLGAKVECSAVVRASGKFPQSVVGVQQ